MMPGVDLGLELSLILVFSLLQIGYTQECMRHEPGKTLSGVEEIRTFPVRTVIECVTTCIADRTNCRAALHHQLPGGTRECTLYRGNSDSPGASIQNPPPGQEGDTFNLYLLVENCNKEGTWTNWEAWAPCSESCGDGIKTRIRECVGGECTEPTSETAFCTTDCGVANEWADWSPFTTCSASCGEGTRSRERTCAGENCVGHPVEVEPCFFPCPSAAAEWAPWEEWTTCTVSCDGGRRNRNRVCQNGNGIVTGKSECEGFATETESCNETPCSLWTAWKDWSVCGVTCGAGIMSRSRECLVGICSGNREETQTCDSGPCPLWQSWGNWGSCTATCGKGTKSRTRECKDGVECGGSAIESKNCDLPPCFSSGSGSSGCNINPSSCGGQGGIGWAQWDPWDQCSKSCSQGFQMRKRKCNGAGGVNDGCPGKDREFQQCNAGDCLSMTWTDWRPCSSTCGAGLTSRIRQCPRPIICGSQTTDVKQCEMQGCGPACLWSHWSSWTQCSASCGDGRSTRTRKCSCRGIPGNDCPGSANEFVACSVGSCSQWQQWSRWSQCGASCGEQGMHVRTRACMNGNLCDGRGMEHQACMNNCNGYSTDRRWPGAQNQVGSGQVYKFGINAGQCSHLWSQWSRWGACSVSCGRGKQSRVRDCQCNSEPSALCSGDNKLTRDCHVGMCPAWLQWSPWSDCSTKCGLGQKTRTRACSHGILCQGNSREHRRCRDTSRCSSVISGPTLPKSSCNWTYWGPWGPCSISCGHGIKERFRECPCFGCVGGSNKEMMLCVKPPCISSFSFRRLRQ